MTSDQFEISIRQHVSDEDIFLCSGKFFNVDTDCVVPDYVLWDFDLLDGVKRIGLKIFHENRGIKTLITANVNFTVYDSTLSEFSRYISSNLNVEVIVSNFMAEIDVPSDEYIVFFPNGDRAMAVEKYDNNGVFDVELLYKI